LARNSHTGPAGSLALKIGAALALAICLGGGSAEAAPDRGDHGGGHGEAHIGGYHGGGGWHGGGHAVGFGGGRDFRGYRGGGGWGGGYYRGPPVIYGSPYYNGCVWPYRYGCAPPVVYGPSIGIGLPGVSVGIY